MSAEGRIVGEGAHVVAEAVEKGGVRDAEEALAKEAEQQVEKQGVKEGEKAAEEAGAKSLSDARKLLDEDAQLEKSSKSEILGKPGGAAERERDFERLTEGAEVKTYQTPKGETRVATLPDGTEVSIRPSSDGRPTIELFTRSPRSQVKYRYKG